MKKKIKYPIVVRFDDLEDEGSNGEYKEFTSLTAAKKWLKEPTQVAWLHQYELGYTIYRLERI